jgi:hypothetical protein
MLQVNTDQFAEALESAHAIKAKHIDPRVEWYKTHTQLPRVIYRLVGISTIVLSVTLPALTAAQFQYKEVIISGMSILIAALTGLGSFYHWDRTWRGNSIAQVSIEQFVAKWELELARAGQIVTYTRRQMIYSRTQGEWFRQKAKAFSATFNPHSKTARARSNPFLVWVRVAAFINNPPWQASLCSCSGLSE